MATMKDAYLFAKRFFFSPSAVGSLLPSSPQLAHCMVKQSLFSAKKPISYLEVGAGSGALTQRLIKKLHQKDTLDIVEKDPQFCAILRRKFGHLPFVRIHEISILEFKADRYDVLISSLPLNAFQASTVGNILKKYEQLVKEGGSLAYYEYLGFEKVKQALLLGDKARDFQKAQNLKSQFMSKYGKKIDRIWWNVPPARVIHCQM